MIFNKSRKLDFPPELEFTDGTKLEVISQTRLVGLKSYQITCDDKITISISSEKQELNFGLLE